jgi:hypothetical protein
MASVLFIPFLLGESMVRFVEDLLGDPKHEKCTLFAGREQVNS